MGKMTNCNSCNAEIAKSAKSCPQCGAKNKKPIYTKWWVWTIVIIIIFMANTNNKGNVTTTSTGESTSTKTTSTTPSTEPTPSVKTYKAGQYKIGTDLPAGEYVITTKLSAMAYFDVTKDSTGEFGSIICNDNFSNRTIITVKDGQYLKITSSTMYAFADAPKVAPTDGFYLQGMYKVGVDIPVGEYKVIADGGTAYVEVAKDSLHSLQSINSNDNFEGEKYIKVSDGQYLKITGAKIKLK